VVEKRGERKLELRGMKKVWSGGESIIGRRSTQIYADKTKGGKAYLRGRWRRSGRNSRTTLAAAVVEKRGKEVGVEGNEKGLVRRGNVT